MALQNSPERQRSAPNYPVAAECLVGVCGAGRVKPARRAQKGRHKDLIPFNEKKEWRGEDLFDRHVAELFC